MATAHTQLAAVVKAPSDGRRWLLILPTQRATCWCIAQVHLLKAHHHLINQPTLIYALVHRHLHNSMTHNMTECDTV